MHGDQLDPRILLTRSQNSLGGKGIKPQCHATTVMDDALVYKRRNGFVKPTSKFRQVFASNATVAGEATGIISHRFASYSYYIYSNCIYAYCQDVTAHIVSMQEVF